MVGEVGNHPKALIAMAAVAKYAKEEIAKVRAKYGAPDNLAAGGQASSGLSLKEVTDKLTLAKDRAAKAPPLSAARKEAESEVETLRRQLSALTG
jgi:hypothetical protein